MKILLLITGLGMGGAESQVVDLADKFVELKHDVLLVYLTGEALVLPCRSEVKVIGLGMRKRLVDFIIIYRKFARIVSDFKPDVVHSHMVHANLFARLVRLIVSFPGLICTAHNTDEGGKIRMLAYRLTDQFADINTNVSKEAVESFVMKGAVKSGRMQLVYNGIDTNRFLPDTIVKERIRLQNTVFDEKIILAVGRLEKAKDYPNLLNSYSYLGDTVEKTQLWIVGCGDLSSSLNELSKKLHVDKQVRFLGIRRDIVALMNAADVFVLSSAWEGFGLVVGEAMACGMVVVATDCGGVKEVMGGNGFLVPPRNSIELSRALKRALTLSDDEICDYGNAARQHIINNFSLTAISDRWIELYQGL